MPRINVSEANAEQQYTLRSDYVHSTLYSNGEAYGRDRESGIPSKTRVSRRFAVFGKRPPSAGDEEFTFQIRLYTNHNCNKLTNTLDITPDSLCGLETGTWNENRPNFCWSSRVVLVSYLAIITEGQTWLFQADSADSQACTVLERWKSLLTAHLCYESSWCIKLESGLTDDMAGERITLYLTRCNLSLVRVNPPLCVKRWPIMQCQRVNSDTVAQCLTLIMAGAYTETNDVFRFSTRRSAEIAETINKSINHQRIAYTSSRPSGSDGSGSTVIIPSAIPGRDGTLIVPSRNRKKKKVPTATLR